MKIDGMRAVVTGGARGIGFATAKRLMEQGVAVSLWDLDGEALSEAARQLEALGSVHTAECDVSSKESVGAAAEATTAALGGVEILVNNAGYMAPGYFLDQPVEKWTRTIDINVNGVLLTTHAFLPHMQERKRAAVVNISSAAGLVGAAGLAVYSASKWSVFGVTEALRAEAVAKGHRGIHFASVHPMFLKTGMFEGARLGGFGRFFFPNVKDHDVVARAIVHFALLRGRRVVKRPRSLRLVLLLRGILPDRWFAALGRAMNLQGSMAGWKGHDKS